MMRTLILLLLFTSKLAYAAGGKNVAKTLSTNTPPTAGSGQPWCVGNPWPLSRDLPIANVVTQLEGFQGSRRIAILQWGWGEIVQGHPKHMIAPIFKYLAGTETNSDLRGYYELMGYLAMNGVDVNTAMKYWPKRQTLNPTRLSLKAMCDDYQKFLDKRQPQSLKKKSAGKKPPSKKSSAP
jgi:hypothetical protein